MNKRCGAGCAGKYVGLLTHSGSRALGANIANHYTRIAIKKPFAAGSETSCMVETGCRRRHGILAGYESGG